MALLSRVYDVATGLRNRLFDREWVAVSQLGVPVVSVGNLTVGGTGKTPMVEFLIRYAQAEGKSVGVISRGYKGKYKGVAEVSCSQPESARIFGDEPTMLKWKWPDVPVFVCGDRAKAGRALLQKHNVDFIIADDAFQHRKLYRDLDIVVFDLGADLSQYKVLPEGRLREGLDGLRRADIILLNKRNLVSSEVKLKTHLDWFNVLFDRYDDKKTVVVLGDYKVIEFKNLYSGECVQTMSDKLEVGALSGVGRPEAFERLLELSGFKLLKHWVFSDHFNYSVEDIKKIIDKSGDRPLMVTEKDAIKLISLEGLDLSNVWSVGVELDIVSFGKSESTDGFYEKFSCLFR